MASIKYDAATKNAAIQFYDSQRRRRGVRLSDVSKSFAERFHSLIERRRCWQRQLRFSSQLQRSRNQLARF